MNKTTIEASDLAQQISYECDDRFEPIDILLCPPFVDLRSVRVTLGFDKSPIALGAQDVYWEKSGAFTGAISAPMLKEVGCTYCIVGHSERRGYFHETDEDINRKAQALIDEGIAPIICCGEDLPVRDGGGALDFVTAQVQKALSGISAEQAHDIVIAYEPIWAIGTGRTATPEQADEVCGAIRKALYGMYGAAFADATRILYGGSMNEGNAGMFKPCENIDGGLIGGASLKANSFMELAKAWI
jgi:triosephosphate isomerase